MLSRLLAGQASAAVSAEVISLTDAGPIAQRLSAQGVRVRSLGMHRGVPTPMSVMRLAAWLRADRPDLVQTWMYHADLIGGVAARLAGVPVVWGLHHTDLPTGATKLGTRLTVAACARLSGLVPDAIVCCSQATRDVHAALGYAADKLTVIPNAFDLDAFRPSATARDSVRQALGLEAGALLIGQFGRFDPQKDHRTFLEAAGYLAARMPHVHFLLAGDDMTEGNAELAAPMRALGLAGRLHLLGRRDDVPRLMAALDLATLSSAFGEGLPLVVGEAMACGVPCVVTDVGDAARVVGDTGLVVPPGKPADLADAWEALLSAEPSARRARGVAARERVATHYPLPTLIARYEALHQATARQRTP
jgi:glycosyltransferase involved in cell wall biosynthesis